MGSIVVGEFDMLKFVNVAMATVLLVGFLAVAQDSTPSTPPPPTKQKRTHGQLDPADKRLRRLSKRINLTDEQKEKIRPILQDEQKQLAGLDSDTTLTPQQKHKKMREIRMSSRSRMDPILTPEQKEKMPSRGAGAGGHHHQKPGAAPQSGSDQTSQQ
jgi:Spy/CpxP family protein refolding chaperone